MKKIKPVSMYPCPETGELFKTPALAMANAIRVCQENEKAAAEALALAERRANFKAISDSFRNELDDISKFASFFREKVQAHMGFDVQFSLPLRFGPQSCSHSSPIGLPTNWCGQNKSLPTEYLGWGGYINGEITGNAPNNVCFHSLAKSGSSFGSDWRADFGGFTGICTGSGSFGKKFQGGVTIWLDDYPILKAKYDEFVKLHGLNSDWKKAVNEERLRTESFVNGLPDITSIDASVAQLEKTIAQLKEERKDKFVTLFARNVNPINPGFNTKDYEFLRGNFQ